MLKNVKLTNIAAGFGVLIALIACGLYTNEILSYPSLTYFENLVIPGADFRAFWAPARLVWQGQAAGAYQPDILTSVMATIMKFPKEVRFGSFYYPPTFLILLAPFGLLPFFPATLAFFATTLILFMTALWVITRRWWFLLLMLSFGGIWVNLVTGQNGLLTSGLFGLGFAFLATNPLVAGIFFGILTVKPHLGLLIPVALLASRNYRAFWAAVLTALFMVILAAVLFGTDIWLWGLSGMATASFNLSQSAVLWLRIPSAFAMLRLSGLVPLQAMLMHLALVACIVVLIWGVWRHSKNYNLNIAATAAATLLVAPFLYDYDMALLAIAIAFMSCEIARTGWWWGERFVLPLAMVWPIAVGWVAVIFGVQLGLLGPVLMLLVVVRRILKEVAVARAASPALNSAL